MIKCSGFHIAPLKTGDALLLSQLMQNNKEQFSDYFPGTLAENISDEKSKQFIDNASYKMKSKEQFLYGLYVENIVIGLVYIKELNWSIKEGEFSYCIDKNHTGKGWITEAIKVLSSIAFTSLNLERLTIIVHKTNIPSVRVAEKCDFSYVKILKNEFTPPGKQSMDMELYVLKK
jgi:ribosomal-protein-alanine N-acetyltransferase